MTDFPAEYEIRVKSLELAVRTGDLTVHETVQAAKAYATYLRDGVEDDRRAAEAEERQAKNAFPFAAAVPDPEPHDVGHPEPDVWGSPCVECTHTAGLHAIGSGCHYWSPDKLAYCPCERSAAECTRKDGVQG